MIEVFDKLNLYYRVADSIVLIYIKFKVGLETCCCCFEYSPTYCPCDRCYHNRVHCASKALKTFHYILFERESDVFLREQRMSRDFALGLLEYLDVSPTVPKMLVYSFRHEWIHMRDLSRVFALCLVPWLDWMLSPNLKWFKESGHSSGLTWTTYFFYCMSSNFLTNRRLWEP